MTARRIVVVGIIGSLGILGVRFYLQPSSARFGALTGGRDAGPVESRADAASPEIPLRTGERAGDVSLVDQSGEPFQFSDLRGEPVVLSFIYTHCDVSSMCPATTLRFSRLRELAVERGIDSAQFLLVSFDPKRDSPERLREYSAERAMEPAALRLATGLAADIAPFARRFNTYFREGPDGRYEHNIVVSILDREGALQAQFPGTAWEPAELLAVLEALVPE